MSSVPSRIQEQVNSRLAQAGASAIEHEVTFVHSLDWNYEIDRKVTSLVEALGVKQFVKSEEQAAQQQQEAQT